MGVPIGFKNPARRCEFVHETGRRCQACAVKGDSFCYHHSQQPKWLARRKADAERIEAARK